MHTGHVHRPLSRAGNDHGRRVTARTGARRLLLAVVALAILGEPTAALAQATQALPAPEPVPQHSRLTVSTLPPPTAPEAPTIKPFRTRDPERLRSWKEKLRGNPGAVLPAPGFVLDTRSGR
jgi:hypothetical protein